VCTAQLYADASEACVRAAPSWEAASSALGGVARSGRVDVATQPALASRLAGAQPGDFPLPLILGFAPRCASVRCARRLPPGRLSAEGVAAFATDTLARLPRVRRLTTAAAVAEFLDGGGEQQERARVLLLEPDGAAGGAWGAPALRAAAARVAADASLARVAPGPAAAAVAARAGDTLFLRSQPALAAWPAHSAPGGPPLGARDGGVTSAAALAAFVSKHRWGDAPRLTRASAPHIAACADGEDAGARQAAPRVCVVVVGASGAGAAAARDAAAALRRRLPAYDFGGGGGSAAAPPRESPLAAAARAGRLALTWLDGGEQRRFCAAALSAAARAQDGATQHDDAVAAVCTRHQRSSSSSGGGEEEDSAPALRVLAVVRRGRGAAPLVSVLTASGGGASAAEYEDDAAFAPLARWLNALLTADGGARVRATGGTPPAPLSPPSLSAHLAPPALATAAAAMRAWVGDVAALWREYALAAADEARADPRRALASLPVLLLGAVLLLPQLCARRGGVRLQRDADDDDAPAAAAAAAPRGGVIELRAATAGTLPPRGAFLVTLLLPPPPPSSSPAAADAAADAADAAREVAHALAQRFAAERRIAFAAVDAATQPAWAPLARAEAAAAAGAPALLAWHPGRARYVRLTSHEGEGEQCDALLPAADADAHADAAAGALRPGARAAARLERLLDGGTRREAWRDAGWPPLV
jgi:hypothetical protein